MAVAKTPNFSQRQAEIWHSPLVFLMGALYAGVVIGAFLYGLSDVRNVPSVIEKTAFLSFTFVFFINATSLILFYIFIVAPLDLAPRDHGVTAAGTFVFVVIYLVTFFVTPAGPYRYATGMIGLGITYGIAWWKYKVIFRHLTEMAPSFLTEELDMIAQNSINTTNDKLFFASVLHRNKSRTRQATLIWLCAGLVILLGTVIPSFGFRHSDSWLLSVFVILVAFYMIFVVVWNFYQILNYHSLRRFSNGGSQVFESVSTDTD